MGIPVRKDRARQQDAGNPTDGRANRKAAKSTAGHTSTHFQRSNIGQWEAKRSRGISLVNDHERVGRKPAHLADVPGGFAGNGRAHAHTVTDGNRMMLLRGGRDSEKQRNHQKQVLNGNSSHIRPSPNSAQTSTRLINPNGLTYAVSVCSNGSMTTRTPTTVPPVPALSAPS